MARQVTRLTRQALYDLVWSEPLRIIAPRYGVSDVALGKACKRHKVPRPGVGYWAIKAAGHHVRKQPLPKLAADEAKLDEIVLGGGGSTNPYLAMRPAAADAAPAEIGPVSDQRRFEALAEHQIEVPDVIEKFRPDVKKAGAALRQKPAGGGVIRRADQCGCVDIRVAFATIGRAQRIMHTLLNALEARGFAVLVERRSHDQKGSQTSVRVGEDKVSFCLEEKTEQVERPKQRVNGYGAQSYFTAPHPRYDTVATGALVLRIDEYTHGGRVSWADGKIQRVEHCLNDFVVGCVAASEALKERRLEFEARERERLAEEQRREQRALERAHHEARRKTLDRQIAAWERARVIREYVSEMREAAAGAAEQGSPLDTWLAWISAYANRIDPRSDPSSAAYDPTEQDLWDARYNRSDR